MRPCPRVRCCGLLRAVAPQASSSPLRAVTVCYTTGELFAKHEGLAVIRRVAAAKSGGAGSAAAPIRRNCTAFCITPVQARANIMRVTCATSAAW